MTSSTSLDTGRLNKETYQLFDKVEKHYGIHIEYTFPEAQEVMDLVRTKGLYSFYEDGHQECCRVRKVRRGSGNRLRAAGSGGNSQQLAWQQLAVPAAATRAAAAKRQQSVGCVERACYLGVC